MKNLCDLTYGIVGLGLMGGSLAKAIRANVIEKGYGSEETGNCSAKAAAVGGCGKIFGSDINASSISCAKEQHVIDEGFTVEQTDEMLSQCDFVYICLYPHATVDFIREHENAFKPGAVISDISGVKKIILEAAEKINRKDIHFIPGHPMAGSEGEGYGQSDGTVFVNHNYILMPLADTDADALTLFKSLITAMGFTRIVETDAGVHDHKIAFTSQLCHVIASALVKSAEDTGITQFGGGSYEDLTRIAMINAPLWTELFLANKDELLGHINDFENCLGELKKYIEENDPESMKKYLEEVRDKRTAMKKSDTRKL